MNMPKTLDVISSAEYQRLFQEMQQRVMEARVAAFKAVNRELVRLYGELGRLIIEKQREFGWGENMAVIDRLASDLAAAFPGVRGFSGRNLRYMRRFFLTYSTDPNLQTLSANLPWSHNTLILDLCEDNQERRYYLDIAAAQHLSYRTLEREIRGGAYKRNALSQTNFSSTLPTEQANRALRAVKDDYNLDFLGLADEHTERELEDALVHNITRFLQEMGGYFTFAGRQVRVEVDGAEYFIDLLFYHRLLKCLVAVELKAGPFQPEHAGKMKFYLSALDDQVRVEGENDSIGIIITQTKSRTVVEYTLRGETRPIGVASYNQYASYSSLDQVPDRIAKYLPSPSLIEQRLLGPQ